MNVRVIGLGSPMGSDDRVGLELATRLEGAVFDGAGVEVIAAGRPGPGLLDLLDPVRPTVVVDAVRAGVEPGRVVRIPLADLSASALAGDALSSHGLGLIEVIRLAEALGRRLPPGAFVGLGGRNFAPGETLSPEVARGMAALVDEVRDVIRGLSPG